MQKNEIASQADFIYKKSTQSKLKKVLSVRTRTINILEKKQIFQKNFRKKANFCNSTLGNAILY